LKTLIIEQHRQNFALWHEEDRARSPRASNDEIAGVKRNIDALNQARNDLVEAIDRELLQQLRPQSRRETAPLHSETPGMIIDRLSILSLKIFHTREELDRPGVSAEHVSRNRERLGVLSEQREDLARCLETLWDEIKAGRRRFKLYRQLKMYNDPELNPEIYKSSED
jgi:phosphate uptake regulator